MEKISTFENHKLTTCAQSKQLSSCLVYLGSTPHRVTVTFIHFDSFLVGNPYKPSFMTVTGWGVDLRYTQIVAAPNVSENQVLLRGDFTLGGVFYW